MEAAGQRWRIAHHWLRHSEERKRIAFLAECGPSAGQGMQRSGARFGRGHRIRIPRHCHQRSWRQPTQRAVRLGHGPSPPLGPQNQNSSPRNPHQGRHHFPRRHQLRGRAVSQRRMDLRRPRSRHRRTGHDHGHRLPHHRPHRQHETQRLWRTSPSPQQRVGHR